MPPKKLKLMKSKINPKSGTKKSLGDQGKKKTLKTKSTNMQNTHTKKKKAITKPVISSRRIGNVENFVLIWLDSNIDMSNSDFRNSITQLRRLVNSIEKFTEISPFMDFMHKIKDERIFLMVSGSLGQHVVPMLENLSKIDSIYVFCSNKSKYYWLMEKYLQVKGVFTDIDDICNLLQVNLQQCDRNITSISVFSKVDRPIVDLNELDPSFMYSQLLKEILVEIEHNEEALKHFIDFCRIEYAENGHALSIIDKFEQNYPRPSPISWYTRQCFLYSMLNKALRTHNIEITIKMGFFIRDLHQQVQKLHSQLKSRETFVAYRGQGISKAEFEKMKQSSGGLLSFNSFLSTSLNQEVALKFARHAKLDSNLVPIFFEMEIDPLVSSTPFVALTDHSCYEEEEVLFSMHTVYRIGEIKPIKEQIWKISLKLTSDSDQQLKDLTASMREETHDATGWHRLVSLMIAMGEYDQAEEFYKSALETTSKSDWKELAWIHDQLGRIAAEMDNSVDALSNYEESLEIKLNNVPEGDICLSDTYIGIGSVLQTQGDLDGALEHFQHARAIVFNMSKPDQLKIATTDNYIGGVLGEQGKFAQALDSYNCALNIRKLHLPSLHPSLATVYNNIGLVYASMNYHKEALSYYEKTLDIERRCYLPNHPSLAITHHNMAMTLECLFLYREAVEHQQTAVDIERLVYDSNHPQLLQEQADLARLRAKL